MSEYSRIIKKTRDYEIRIRRAVDNHLQGNFSSLFKGSGLEFDDVRPYQYGDDVRRIDWNVSAKGHGTFIKTFKEEKEQHVEFLVDISGSLDIGQKGNTKANLATEVCGALALSALNGGSQVGLTTFSEETEKIIKPGKGKKHGFILLKTLVDQQRKQKGTSLKKALSYAQKLYKKRSIVVVISDFRDVGYEEELKNLAKRHDLICIQVSDKKEYKLPKIGLMPLKEIESGQKRWANTLLNPRIANFEKEWRSQQKGLNQLCNLLGADYLLMETNGDVVSSLVKLFKVRKYKGRLK